MAFQRHEQSPRETLDGSGNVQDKYYVYVIRVKNLKQTVGVD